MLVLNRFGNRISLTLLPVVVNHASFLAYGVSALFINLLDVVDQATSVIEFDTSIEDTGRGEKCFCLRILSIDWSLSPHTHTVFNLLSQQFRDLSTPWI